MAEQIINLTYFKLKRYSISIPMPMQLKNIDY